MRELNRLGVTSIIDAGGGYQNFPDDDAVIEDLHRRGEMTLRIAYNLFTQKPKQETEDFARWIRMTGAQGCRLPAVSSQTWSRSPTISFRRRTKRSRTSNPS